MYPGEKVRWFGVLDLPGKILIGPVYNYPVMLGKWLGHPDLKIFVTQPEEAKGGYDLVYTPGQDSLSDLLDRLPSGWEPDWILWWDLVFQPLPKGIEKSPCPLLAMVGDWNLGFQTVLDYAGVFDFLIGDLPLVALLKARGIEHCAALRCYSFLPELHRPQPALEKNWDLSFVGNLNYHIHRGRSYYLQHLADLSERYRVRLANGIFGRAYAELLAQSRIVFNHSVRGEMNMRAYEAPACGALLMMEAENAEIGAVLQDGISCVLYSREDFEDKIHHYLHHETERQQIAAVGQRIIQAHTYTAQFEKIFALLPRVKPRLRPFGRRSQAEQVQARWKQMLTAQTQITWAALVGELEQMPFTEVALCPAQIALWIDCAFKFRQGGHNTVALTCLKQARQGLEKLSDTRAHWLTAYLQAWLACGEEEPQQALDAFGAALACLNTLTHQDLQQDGRFVLPLGFFQPFEVEWQRLWAFSEAPATQVVAARLLLTWQIHFQMGEIWAQRDGPQRDLVAARAAYQQAIQARPDLGLTYWRLGQLEADSDCSEPALLAFRQAAERGVLEPEMWVSHASLALRRGQTAEARQVAVRGLALLQTASQQTEAQRQLQSLLRGADFCLALEQAEPERALLALQDRFDPLYLALLPQLKAFFSDPSRDLLWALGEPYPVFHWVSSLGEPPPVLPTESGLGWSEQGLRLGRPSEAASVDLVVTAADLPYAFLPNGALAPISLDELAETSVLLIATAPFQASLSQALFQLHGLRQGRSAHLFLWLPQATPLLLTELEALAEQAGWSEMPDLTLLIEPLSLVEVGGLLRQMQGVLGFSPEIDYYLAWARRLGASVGLWPDLEQNEAVLNAWWQACCPPTQADPVSASALSSQERLDALWHWRLRQLQGALGAR